MLLLGKMEETYTPGENNARSGRSDVEIVSNSFRSEMYLNPLSLASAVRSLSSKRHDPERFCGKK